ncbi:MAG TPA: peptidase U32 [Clostridiales bacterium]|nr:peptidase U32 [Clostridiales bacterium]HCU56577.1 peptidase U32 [Clostridiales bacterium]
MKLELLSPAGNLEKMKVACHFGADAVYFAGKEFGLRAYADNFTEQEMAQAFAYLHSIGKKGYVTLNVFPYDEDFSKIKEYLPFVKEINADGVIVSDPGVISLARSIVPDLELHLSTQANTLNSYSARFWADMGVKRIVLARELSLDRIKAIRDALDPSVEIECFAHGAMCISYSGRCLLSNYLSGRDNYKGECVQACRWNYVIHEKNRNSREFPIEEDERGAYIMNSHDLKTITFLDRLIDAGVTSFKIEGRMKTAYYVASVTDAYRRALDEAAAHPRDYHCKKEWEEELSLCSNRGFTTGFMLGGKGGSDTIGYEDSKSDGGAEFIGKVLGYDFNKKCVIIEQRNRFSVGDKLELLAPAREVAEIPVKEIFTLQGESIQDALRVQEKLLIPTEIVAEEGDILRRRKT